MVDQQAVIWIPEYGTDNELYLLAIFVVPPDPEWWPDDEPTEIPVFLGYISKRVSPLPIELPSASGRPKVSAHAHAPIARSHPSLFRMPNPHMPAPHTSTRALQHASQDPLSKPDQKWTGSPVLRECHRLWRKKTPLVLDLDETLGCSPSDCFHPEQDAPDHLEKEVREHIGNVEPGMNAAKQEAFYQNLIKSWTHEKEKAMWAHMQYNRSIKVRTRVQAMDRLLKSDLPADSSMLLDACDQQYFLYTEGSVQRVLFLRPHLTKLLKLALTEFDTYIVTAATEEHSKVFFSAMDHFFRDKKPGNHFLFDLDESGQKLTHALGSAAACSEKKLETTSRTSHFSTIIVDDCRGSRGIGSGCGAEQTWPHDMRSVYTVKAWNPIQADADHDDELEKLAGWEGASGVLLRCSRDFFDKLGSFSNKMASSNGWYDAKTHCAKKGFEPPRMNEEVDVQLKNRAQRPSSPRASTLECLVLDTNSLIQMCARDQNVDINAPQNLIPNYADCFKVLEKIIVNLSGRIKVVIPYVVVRELDKLKEKMVDGGPTQTAKAARRANKYLSDQGDAEVLEMEKDPLKELDKKIHFAKLRGENAEDAIHLRHERTSLALVPQYNKLNTNDARIVHQTLQRINVHNCVILTNDNNMKLVAKQNGIDCLNLHEVSDYVLNRNKEHAQNMLPTVWVERRNARAKSEMEAQAGAASVLPSQGKMRWQTEHSTSRPGTRKYYFNWRENRSQYNRPTEAPPAPWYYKDSSEVEQGPLELHMQIVRMVSSGVLNSESFEQVMPSLQKLHEDHKISNDTLVRSEHTDDKWRSYRDV
ncbi:MAG: hypothetical protein SGPRY_008336, partial [Prymnesium sp.]